VRFVNIPNHVSNRERHGILPAYFLYPFKSFT
jgi:hypothetical protein